MIKTPENAGQSKIESLFDVATRSMKLNGKSFNPDDKDVDTDTEYGKSRFASQVVAPNADKINFTGFVPLLDRIVATINFHNKLVAAGAV